MYILQQKLRFDSLRMLVKHKTSMIESVSFCISITYSCIKEYVINL